MLEQSILKLIFTLCVKEL
uniref:Uncharacterized protein n=1 Tax=Arundo donax TaxID=35708 RepID=A0A0A9BT76_ARUDO